MAYDMIVDYALTGERPNLTAVPLSVISAVSIASPKIELGLKRAKAGTDGGKISRKTISEISKNKQIKAKISKNKQNSEGSNIYNNYINNNLDNSSILESSNGKEKEEKTKKGGMGGNKKFQPPTLEEVLAYIKEKGWGMYVDAESFIAYNSSCGWKIGKSGKPMVDWKAAVRTWMINSKKKLEASRSEVKVYGSLTGYSGGNGKEFHIPAAITADMD